MANITRRTLLGWAVMAPVLPNLLIETARAGNALTSGRHEGRVIVVVRMMGGNDGLNTVVPIRDDRYYRARPNIAMAKAGTLTLPGGDVGLHSSLSGFHSLMEEGYAGIVQGVGYPKSSRSHVRSTEIWETASLADRAPANGWLGRYLDAACNCAQNPVSGIQFGDSYARTLAASTDTSRLIGNPDPLLQLNVDETELFGASLHNAARFSALQTANAALLDTARQVQRARKGSGARFPYPASAFGQALRWAGDMIETECPTRIYYLRAGSFENGASSFDTHLDQIETHRQLYSELGHGINAFATHLRTTQQFKRVTLLTFSDFGRQLPENRTKGTEHGDASVMLYAGGAVRAGLQGSMPDLGKAIDGGLPHSIDFRSVYADVLSNWLDTPAAPLLGEAIESFPILKPA